MKRGLSIPEQHQLQVAQRTLKMNDVMANVMGGMTKAQAQEIVNKLTSPAPRRGFALHAEDDIIVP